MDIKWDFKAYHAKPPKWRDLGAEREAKKRRERERMKEDAEKFLRQSAAGTDEFGVDQRTKEAASTDDQWEQSVAEGGH